MRAAVFHASREGHAVRVAERAAAVLEAEGFDARVKPAASACEEDVTEADLVVLAASVHMGRHDKAAVGLARAHRDRLAERSTAFLSVSLTAVSPDEEKRREVEAMIRAFGRETGWTADRVLAVAGALRYTRYGFLERWMMKRIARQGGLDTDTERDHVYTDWEALEGFVREAARDAKA